MPPQDAALFTWTDLPLDAPMPLARRRRIIGKHVMLSEVELDRGFEVPSHAHENEQMACVISGSLRFGIGVEGSADYREVVAPAGTVMHLPSNVPHSAVALEDSRVLDIFSPPSERTGIDGPDSHG